MDYILRATAGNGSVRVFVANTRETVEKAFEFHKTSPVISAALGRALTGAAMMGSMLKGEDDLLTITIKGDGPAGNITVTSDSKARVKGYVSNPRVDLPLNENGKLDVKSAVGEGTLTVIKDMGMKEPYVGQIPLQTGEIAEDLTYYFAKSEQTPSAVALGVLVDKDYTIKQAGGFIIQIMPDADDDIIFSLEIKLHEMEPMTTMFEKGMSVEDIMDYLIGDLDPVILDKVPVEYYCNCSRERVEKALISIGKKEIAKILEEDGKATLHCHFCNKDYDFDENDLLNLIKEENKEEKK